MWFRGRTVVAMMIVTALVAGMATYAVFEYSGWALKSRDSRPGVASSDMADGLNQAELDKINKAVGLIEHRYIAPADRNKLIDGAVQGMVESLNDPFSVYKSEEEAEKFSDSLQGAFTGIGATLNVVNGFIVVEAPIRGSPAERAGLQPKDILLSVNGDNLQGLQLNDAVAKIRGPKGTKAKLKVRREGLAEPLDLELVRDRIDLQTVSADFGTDGVGQITINQFTEDTSGQFADELGAMWAKGLKALVIDVRDNPGGMLQSVIEIADQLLVKDKPIVQSEYRDGKRNVDVATHGAKNGIRVPIVVLMNKGSASAAEILAGALKQSAGAILIGEQTYGKGTVQASYPHELGDRSLMKLTIYKWLLPDGTWIHEKGISPDIAVEQPAYFQASRLPRDIVMKYDTTGEAVMNLQNILAGVGFPADRNDGYFSQGTALALKAFQKRESLEATGEVTAETAQRLEEALYSNLLIAGNDKQLQAALAKARELANASK
ncbi:PDZ domain-containing protein [Cohnella endophytica]|uniref:PDZ domain-containing protein n=1 Tax=Cohnella endophytica TaxID=2419778 RepID=A0A494X920_9BACL|nr:S41 family peptidase [Cohnella endophytica]RKP47217.1 PDZ domain-containing protein [Cohnella endophytica]